MCCARAAFRIDLASRVVARHGAPYGALWRAPDAGALMGDLSITDAVRLSGKSRSSILRAIKSGALSARRGPGGAFLIDRSELARVYAVGSPAPDGAPDGAVLRHEIDRLRADLADAERRAAVAEALAEERARSLSDLRRLLPAPAPASPVKARRRWWPFG